MPKDEEPSYMFFAREAVKANVGVSSAVVKELIARIDRDSAKIKELS